MSPEKTRPEFKKSYPYVFNTFYTAQGFYNGLQAVVLPLYLITVIKDINLAYILMILAVATIPWSLKFLIGMMNDKYSIGKKLGRRKPWIFIFGLWGAVWFIIAGIMLPQQLGLERSVLLNNVMVFALMWNIGWAIADTALDGLILDVTPKEKLGKIQGTTWGINLFGSSAGGLLVGALVLMFHAFTLFFMLEGVLMIVGCTLPFIVKESEIPADIHVWHEFKDILSKKSNWKLFIMTILDDIPYGVVTLAYGLLIIIYWPTKLVDIKVTSITLAAESLDLFMIFAIVGAIGGIGVIAGSILTGRVSDKNRRHGVYLTHIIYIPCLLLCVLFSGAFMPKNIVIPFSIAMTILLSAGEGSNTTSFQTIRGDLAKRYPNLDSTYYALVVSCLNAGTMIGYALVGVLILVLSAAFSEFWLIFLIIMIIMAGFQLASFGILMTIPKAEYEFATIISKNE